LLPIELLKLPRRVDVFIEIACQLAPKNWLGKWGNGKAEKRASLPLHTVQLLGLELGQIEFSCESATFFCLAQISLTLTF